MMPISKAYNRRRASRESVVVVMVVDRWMITASGLPKQAFRRSGAIQRPGNGLRVAPGVSIAYNQVSGPPPPRPEALP